MAPVPQWTFTHNDVATSNVTTNFTAAATSVDLLQGKINKHHSANGIGNNNVGGDDRDQKVEPE